ncbi:hypothetical protein SAMN06297387_106144 [Streptomyces zhaozhouensis]|uniref:AAA+ ATPase domain-containing protein n=1 Tax=Streptomyces zhaozhouensis TaxID=1300267 RepID=A0A286DV75_9ACTN|nr:ATP-binding protein [Streptomyces zhaozhouensis]SOD62567.1 hypothetical protein SAMN06297387_106144 [Streptomyces zhaozhouensis]
MDERDVDERDAAGDGGARAGAATVGGTSPFAPSGGARRVEVGGDARGPVIAGDRNVVVDAQLGSHVTVLVEGERPRPVRRSTVALPPRRQSAPPLGREDELAALTRAVAAGEQVQLWGDAGVGKSTLLRQAARELPPGADGVVFVSASGREAGDIAQELFESCYEAPGYVPTRGELRRLMAGVRLTVYVDNADLAPEQLEELMDAAPDATFVFAGVERSLWSGGTAIRLVGLRESAAHALLERELGRPIPEEETEAATALWSAASGLPLPLVRAAALAGLAPGGGGALPRPGQVAELLPMLLDGLSADRSAMDVLHLMVTLDETEIAPAHIGALTNLDAPVELCERLVRLGLLLAGEHGYRCTADLRPAVRARFPVPFSVERLCGHFTRWVGLAGTTSAEVVAHGPALDVVAALAERNGHPDLAVRLTRAAAVAMARSLRFGAWGVLLGRGWGAARSAGDRRAEAFFTHEQGVRALLIGKHAVAATLMAEAAWLGREWSTGGGGTVDDSPPASSAEAQSPTEGARHDAGAGAGDPPVAETGAGPATHQPADGVGPATPEGTSSGMAQPEPPPFEPPCAEPSQPVQPAEPSEPVSLSEPVASSEPASLHSSAEHSTPLEPSRPVDDLTTLDQSGFASQAPPPPPPPASPPGNPYVTPQEPSHGGGGYLDGPPRTGHDGGWGGGLGGGDGGAGQALAGAGGQGAAASAGAGGTALGMGGSLLSVVIGGGVALALGGVILGVTLNDSGDEGGAEQAATGLAGAWQDEWGGVWTVTDDGGGAFSMRAPGQGCGVQVIEITGDGDEFSGRQEWFDADCEPLGWGDLDLLLADDGQSLALHASSPPDLPPCEVNCDVTLTRQKL